MALVLPAFIGSFGVGHKSPAGPGGQVDDDRRPGVADAVHDLLVILELGARLAGLRVAHMDMCNRSTCLVRRDGLIGDLLRRDRDSGVYAGGIGRAGDGACENDRTGHGWFPRCSGRVNLRSLRVTCREDYTWQAVQNNAMKLWLSLATTSWSSEFPCHPRHATSLPFSIAGNWARLAPPQEQVCFAFTR